MSIPKKKICTLDVETAGEITFPLIYDLGWTCHDRKGNIFQRKNYLVQEIWDNPGLMEAAFYASKIPMYIDMLRQGKITVLPFQTVMKELKTDILSNNISLVMAYNVLFDMRAIRATSLYLYENLNQYKEFKGISFFENVVMRRPIQVGCIWNIACEIVAKTPAYAHWVLEQERNAAEPYKWISEKYNPRTSAEKVYSFITRNPEFIESHTALHDAEIETEIFAYLMSRKKKIDWEVNYMPWQGVGQYFRENFGHLAA